MAFIRILSLFIASVFILTSSASAKPFDNGGSGIYVGEVSCYGEHEIRPEFLHTFREKLSEQLNIYQGKGNFRIINSKWLLGADTSSNFGGIIKVDSVLQDIHMDAIVYAPSFQKENANVKMIHYAERALGEDYFWDDEKLAARKKMAGKPYHISPKMTEAAKTFGRETGADYLLFCNLVNADIELKNSIFNTSTTLNERPKKIVVESFFYLVDTKTGLVCEGKIFSDKTGQILNLLGQYGKAMTAENLLQCMFEVQSKRIVEDMCNEGKKILAGGN